MGQWKFLLGSAVLLAGPIWALAQDPGSGKKNERAKVAPSVQAWVKTLAGKIADRHDLIRQSARLAIISLGRDALPTLRAVADGKDDAAAYAAKQLIQRIEHCGRPGPGGRGFGRGRRPGLERAGFAFRRHPRGGRGSFAGHRAFGRGGWSGAGSWFNRGVDLGRRWGRAFGGAADWAGSRNGAGAAARRRGGPAEGIRSGPPPGPRGAGGLVRFGVFAGGPGRMGPVGGPVIRNVLNALESLNLTSRQKDELKTVPDKMRTALLKEMKGILTQDQYTKFEAALKKTPLPPLHLTAPASGSPGRRSSKDQ